MRPRSGLPNRPDWTARNRWHRETQAANPVLSQGERRQSPGRQAQTPGSSMSSRSGLNNRRAHDFHGRLCPRFASRRRFIARHPGGMEPRAEEIPPEELSIAGDAISAGERSAEFRPRRRISRGMISNGRIPLYVRVLPAGRRHSPAASSFLRDSSSMRRRRSGEALRRPLAERSAPAPRPGDATTPAAPCSGRQRTAT